MLNYLFLVLYLQRKDQERPDDEEFVVPGRRLWTSAERYVLDCVLDNEGAVSRFLPTGRTKALDDLFVEEEKEEESKADPNPRFPCPRHESCPRLMSRG